MKRYLVTGSTGFLGRELVVRMLREGHWTMVTMRRRGPDDTLVAAEGRFSSMVRELAADVPLDRARVVFGDVTERGLGLAPEARAWLDEGEPVQIVHGAAQVRFDLPYAEMESQNVQGTENVLSLARSLAAGQRLLRLDYVSTAYVAGDRTGPVREDEIDAGQHPRNTYERSKLEAERCVARERERGLPVTVHRPSIIVGDSRTGRASSFKVLYWPMKIYANGRFHTCFGRPACPVDVVPVDYVADAMMHLLSRADATGLTFHLAAGPNGQSTIGELAGLMESFFGGKKIRYVDPIIYQRWIRPIVLPVLKMVRPDVARRGGVFLPYLMSNPTFCTDRAAQMLSGTGLEPPRVRQYFETIMRYARDHDFGAARSRASA